MEGLDVKSLFPNNLLKEIINNCVIDIHDKYLSKGKLNKFDLFKLLETANNESPFIFYFLLYKEVDGVAMGSSLGPTLANVVLCYFEKDDWTIFHLICNLLYTIGILMIFLFFFHLKNISSLL